MLHIKKILLPVDFPNTTIRVIQQAATLARHFGSEILMLHVVIEHSYTAGVPRGTELAHWDLLAAILKSGAKDPQHSVQSALNALTVRTLVIEGDPFLKIVKTAREQGADLIMMPSHGFTFSQFLLGSVTAKVLDWEPCPVWTGAHVDEPPTKEFAINKILCAVDFGLRSDRAVMWATQLASAFGARLTLAYVTPGVEFWGPGGYSVNQEWKEALVRNATRQMADLQQRLGTNAEVFIGSGDVPKVLGQAVSQTNADLLVTGSYPYGVHLRTQGYAIMCAVPVPVLNV
jgi:nucleotide-binding universal stress UspA family protein